ncbi:T9SS type A sorting domain-containing protein [Psychroserpens ponticola]|uniref:T9SS type A sorting domain-containing protein n=1 Tax=Psychroserpens ponticola TaxID=2932268 RepID=A0ABY7RZR4_9FLAO|nr:T9SS type A sorting domain-containing protein [Psychroserpens ponticola]WCO02166.1 T9SS type A sorting domain-containing protein [Psychroserpens ponticola]
MKKITLLLLFCLTAVSWSYSQCFDPVYQYPPTTVTLGAIPGPQEIAEDNWPQNEFSVLDGLVIGESYTVTATPDQTDPDYTPGAMTYITVSSDGITEIVSGFDSVSFVATTAGITIFWTLDAACNDGPDLNTETAIECTTCTCDATAAPEAVSNPTPADLSDVVLTLTGGTTFAWDESMTGDAADSFTIFIGTTMAADEIGFLTNATSGNGVNFGGVANTTYFWKVDAINCFGTTTSAVWSFNTIDCPEVAAPACNMMLAPTDNQMDVATVEATDTSREVNLSWNAIAGADSYQITFDGNVLGATPETDIDIFGLDYNTSYTWSIAPTNCFGAAAACSTFTFTTEEDPALSVAQFENQSLSVYPNPVKDQLTIKTELSIETVEIFNILGKQVKSISGNSMLNNKVDMTSLLDGIYFLNITAEGKKQTIKVIKQ